MKRYNYIVSRQRAQTRLSFKKIDVEIKDHCGTEPNSFWKGDYLITVVELKDTNEVKVLLNHLFDLNVLSLFQSVGDAYAFVSNQTAKDAQEKATKEHTASVSCFYEINHAGNKISDGNGLFKFPSVIAALIAAKNFKNNPGGSNPKMSEENVFYWKHQTYHIVKKTVKTEVLEVV